MSNNTTMGRRERKREATRSQIVAAARSLFAEQRYDEVTIDDITGRADVAKGTFYLHFRTKEDVVSEVYNDLIRPAVEEVYQAISDQAPARALLASFFQAVAAPAGANPRLAQTAFSHGMSEVYAEPQEDDDLFSTTLIKIVAQGQKSGELRPDWRPAEMAMMLGALFGTTVWAWAAMPTGEPLEERLKRCLTVCFEGMAVSNAQASGG